MTSVRPPFHSFERFSSGSSILLSQASSPILEADKSPSASLRPMYRVDNKI